MDELADLGFKNVSLLLSPGVYILCYRGKVVYIGQSDKPFQRIGHHGPNYKFDQVFFRRCKADELLALERMLTRRFKPETNRITALPPDTKWHEPKPGEGSWVPSKSPRFADDNIQDEKPQVGAGITVKVGGLELALRKKQPG